MPLTQYMVLEGEEGALRTRTVWPRAGVRRGSWTPGREAEERPVQLMMTGDDEGWGVGLVAKVVAEAMWSRVARWKVTPRERRRETR